MKRFLILLIFQTTSAFAADPLCETALSELHALKLNYLSLPSRADASILKKSYDNKVVELAKQTGTSVKKLEDVISKTNSAKIKTLPVSTVDNSAEANVEVQIEKLFRRYDDYEKLVLQAKEFATYFINEQEKNSKVKNVIDIFNYFRKTGIETIWFDDLRSMFLFMALPSKFLTKPQIKKYESAFSTNFSVYKNTIHKPIEDADLILIEILTRYLNIPSDNILYYIVEKMNENVDEPFTSPQFTKKLITELHISTATRPNMKHIGSILNMITEKYSKYSAFLNPKPMKRLFAMAEAIISVSPELLEERNEEGVTPIFLAKGDELFDLFLKAGANVNHVSAAGITPLHHAVIEKNINIFTKRKIESLIAAGADHTLIDPKGRTPYLSIDDISDPETRDSFFDIFEKHGIRD